MASPPPPYDNITGISRAVMKDTAQETLAGYNGSARPGELVVNLVTDPPALYIGNNSGQLTAITSGGGSTGNITFSDTTMSPPDGVDITISAANSEVIIEALDIRLDATDDLRLTGSDLVSLRNRSVTDDITIRTDYDNNDYTWRFGVDGVFEIPGDIVVAGDVTGTASANTLVLKAQPASNTSIQLNSIVDSSIRTVANLEIITDSSSTAQTWRFGTTGDFTSPGSVITAPVLLANLTAVAGARAFVSDGNLAAAGNFGAQIGSGGANTVPVWSDGTNWYVG